MQRRTLLQLLLGAASALSCRVGLSAQTFLRPTDQDRIAALADLLLPQEIGDSGRTAVVRDFLRWHAEYRAGTDTDHGYGFPRLRKTPAPPAVKYSAQLDDLDLRAKPAAASFAQSSADARRVIVAAAINDAGVERLPARPDGGHVASDLLGFYFHSDQANDVCYRRAIGADTCRGLEGSENRPAPLASEPR